ncbi:MAG TPA: DUF1054 domain-containing protein [Symbiobacteriaceae bacterium]|nr:DUF1054 domain-containing protein [Symbiobacteriaceae bacterium]
MTFPHFTPADFDAFDVPGLEDRMAAIKAGPRPKLEALGQLMLPELARLTGRQFFPHIAKHARRKINPPTDTWIAWSTNPRGYKMAPHFQVGLWESHLFIQAGVIYEAAGRAQFGARLLASPPALPGHYRWLEDYMVPTGIRQDAMTRADWERLADRLANRKQADAMVGIDIPRADAVALRGDELVGLVIETLETLVPVWRLAAE